MYPWICSPSSLSLVVLSFFYSSSSSLLFFPYFPLSLSSSLPLKKEKKAELRRREEGKQVELFQREQEVRRNQTWIEERKKARLEEKRAREAVSV